MDFFFEEKEAPLFNSCPQRPLSFGISSHFSFSIYSTLLTKSLVLQHYPQLDDSLFVEIEIWQSVVVDDPDGAFTVTAFDANHCPGNLLFFFFSKSVDKETEVLNNASLTIGSSKSYSERFRKFYWTMNVPVPQPLPSLVELMKANKRAKRKFEV
ncbi:hypothetical protein ACB092_04G063200 [Castanea dentata]